MKPGFLWVPEQPSEPPYIPITHKTRNLLQFSDYLFPIKDRKPSKSLSWYQKPSLVLQPCGTSFVRHLPLWPGSLANVPIRFWTSFRDHKCDHLPATSKPPSHFWTLQASLILALDHIHLESTPTEFSVTTMHTDPGSLSSVGSLSSLTPYVFFSFPPVFSAMVPFYLELASLYGAVGYLNCSGGSYQGQHVNELPSIVSNNPFVITGEGSLQCSFTNKDIWSGLF